jgi:hypothetical protein
MDVFSSLARIKREREFLNEALRREGERIRQEAKRMQPKLTTCRHLAYFRLDRVDTGELLGWACLRCGNQLEEGPDGSPRAI